LRSHDDSDESIDLEQRKEFNKSVQGTDDQDKPQNTNSMNQSQNSRRNKVFETLMKYTGEADTIEMPITRSVLPWHFFNVDLWSNERTFSEVEDIANENMSKLIDLRPYMIEQPFKINCYDRLPKVLDYFRHFHLRALPVIDPNDGKPVAILTRQDIFAYMSL